MRPDAIKKAHRVFGMSQNHGMGNRPCLRHLVLFQYTAYAFEPCVDLCSRSTPLALLHRLGNEVDKGPSPRRQIAPTRQERVDRHLA